MNPAPKQRSKLGLLVVAAMVGITVYWGFTYSGPYRFLAELQLKWFRVYYPEVTGLIIVLGMLCVAGLIKVLFRGAERPVPRAAASTSNNAAVTAGVDQRWLRYLPYFIVVLTFVAIGARDFYKGAHAGSLRQLNAEEFYNGSQQSLAFYADVRGHLSQRYLSRDDYFYVPMTGGEKTAGPIRLVVGGNKNEFKKSLRRETDGTARVWGIVDKGLEADVRYAFEKNGYAVSDAIWVLHAGRAPSDEKGLGLFMTGFGVAAAGILFGVQRFKDRKKAIARPVQATA